MTERAASGLEVSGFPVVVLDVRKARAARLLVKGAVGVAKWTGRPRWRGMSSVSAGGNGAYKSHGHVVACWQDAR